MISKSSQFIRFIAKAARLLRETNERLVAMTHPDPYINPGMFVFP